jgi:alcohol dehydrogenase
MLGAAHSAANPLSSQFDVIHGRAVAIMIPQVMAYNFEDKDALAAYARLARKSLLANPRDNDHDAARTLRSRVIELVEKAGLSLKLKDHGVSAVHVEALAQEAALQWTAQFNPRSIDQGGFQSLYQSALASI